MPFARSAAHRIALFPVPKNACTTFKEVIHLLEHGAFLGRRRRPDGAPWTVHEAYPGTRPFAPADLEATAGDWRFAILRHPVDRLVSAHKNKVARQGALSARALGAAARDLPPDPDFATLVARLGDYRAASAHLRHHTDPHTLFLGRDPGAFDALFRLDEIEAARAAIERRAGRPIPLPPVLNATGRFPSPTVTPALRRRVEAFYAEDLEVFGRFLRPAG